MAKPLIYAAVVATLLGGIETAGAAYVIKLKNGNEYITTRYWHEGGQVLFDSYGGVFGIERAFVSKIEGSIRPVPQPIPASSADKPSDVGNQSTTSGTVSEQVDAKGHEMTSTRTPKEPLKKDDEVLKEYNALRKRFSELNDLPKYEVQALADDIDSFRRKVKNSALAEAHKEEIDAMGSLQSTIDSYLKAAYP